ncbi:eukaryotic translation initiation factor 3 subunit 7-domain-containing protein [Phakopsora pachyrhizi]|uniref:Eukaryotic translation initiation factor 3 subunit 7-domain-containing protein n=1 Tax=Phakopsora pachyrhizi TaxID=170000 RepID=A0AAV0BDE3_PHAPC|nr:eukaryotic translation initiation factor 3 subunit 7-domain-containing protein [Phakopsora pachyrhizi]
MVIGHDQKISQSQQDSKKTAAAAAVDDDGDQRELGRASFSRAFLLTLLRVISNSLSSRVLLGQLLEIERFRGTILKILVGRLWSDELRSDCEPSENLTPDDGNCEEEWEVELMSALIECLRRETEDSIFKNIDMIHRLLGESSSNQPTTPIGLLSNLTSTIQKNSNLSKGSGPRSVTSLEALTSELQHNVCVVVNFTNKSGCPPCKTIAPVYRDLSSKFSTNNLSTRHSVNSNIKKTSRKPIMRSVLYNYDRSYDRINTKNPQPLQILDQSRYHPTASKDPVIQELASQGKAKVFTTDSILSLLMCATRSVYPWDIVIVKEGDKLFMDKQEGGHLNAADPPMESEKPDSLNTPSALSLEVTFINQNFGLKVVKEDPDNAYQLDNPNPFYGSDKTEPCASAGLRYQKFDLSLNEDGDLMLLIRAETAVEEDSFIAIRTLNKFNSNSHGSGSAPNWRAKLNSQCGAVVATEMKNNSCKLAKWAVQSILAGADQMNMG